MVIVIEKINMVVAATIGLVSELSAGNKQRQPDSNADHDRSVDEPTSSPYPENDEQQWELDGVQQSMRALSTAELAESDAEEEQRKIRNPAHQADEFLKRHPTPVLAAPSGRLARPVIIPQRRPGMRVRGFVRAYAPDLMACGVDQDTFMDFLVSFTRAGRAPEWMRAVNLVGFTGFAIPAHTAGFGVGLAVQIVNAIAMELRGRTQSNEFLKELNDGFFRPRNLYCLVMSFDNTHETALTEKELNNNISKASTEASGVKKITEKLRTHDEPSGPVEFPKAVPLIFPELDWIAANGNPEQTKKIGKYVKFRKQVADYYDRRAQAEYASKNPESPLAAPPQRGFTSKFGDPRDDTNLSPISLATGGAVPFKTTGYWDRSRKRGRKLANKVLYLTIVNMPSESDMDRAGEVMEQASVA